jgi:DNA replication and repair protein RecF
LDASRVEQIVKLVSGDRFGQIFITDTNRDHLDKIMQKIEGEYKVFEVADGAIEERKGIKE